MKTDNSNDAGSQLRKYRAAAWLIYRLPFTMVAVHTMGWRLSVGLKAAGRPWNAMDSDQGRHLNLQLGRGKAFPSTPPPFVFPLFTFPLLSLPFPSLPLEVGPSPPFPLICPSPANDVPGMQRPDETKKLCYRKDDRARCPIYGCPENFRDTLTMPMATFLKTLWAFVPMVPSERALVSS